MGNSATIQVEATDSDSSVFQVTVRDGGSRTRHRVTLQTGTYQRLTGGRVSQGEFLEAAFRFLLEREPKEAILASFDVEVISRYFPSFEKEISGYLS